MEKYAGKAANLPYQYNTAHPDSQYNQMRRTFGRSRNSPNDFAGDYHKKVIRLSPDNEL